MPAIHLHVRLVPLTPSNQGLQDPSMPHGSLCTGSHTYFWEDTPCPTCLEGPALLESLCDLLTMDKLAEVERGCARSCCWVCQEVHGFS